MADAGSSLTVVSRRFDAVVFFVDDMPIKKVYGSYHESFNVTFTMYKGYSLVDVDRASFINLINRQAFGSRYNWSETPYVRLVKPASVEGVRDIGLLQPWNLTYRREDGELRLANCLLYTRSPTLMVEGSSPVYYGRFETGFELQFGGGEKVVTETLTVYEVELRIDEAGARGSVQFVKVGNHFSPVDKELSLAEAGLSNPTIEVANMARVLTSLQQGFEDVETENRKLSSLVANLTADQLPLRQTLVETGNRAAELESQNYQLQAQLERVSSKKEEVQGAVDRLTAVSVAFFIATVALIGSLLWLLRTQY